jgi:hypothetical protein
MYNQKYYNQKFNEQQQFKETNEDFHTNKERQLVPEENPVAAGDLLDAPFSSGGSYLQASMGVNKQTVFTGS